MGLHVGEGHGYGVCVFGVEWRMELVFGAFMGWVLGFGVRLVRFQKVLLYVGSFSTEGMVGLCVFG